MIAQREHGQRTGPLAEGDLLEMMVFIVGGGVATLSWTRLRSGILDPTEEMTERSLGSKTYHFN